MNNTDNSTITTTIEQPEITNLASDEQPDSENHESTEMPAGNTGSKAKKESSNLKLSAAIKKLLEQQAQLYGLTQSAYVAVLIIRNADGADAEEFEREVDRAKAYMC